MKECIEQIKQRIDAAKVRAGRTDEILLIAVSKTQEAARILEAKALGLSVFGENRVQELIEKYPEIPEVEWHLIGHLQKNKVKYIIDKVRMIHSLDSMELAHEIDRRAAAIGRTMDVLLQINIGRELTKSGIMEEDTLEYLKELSSFEHICVKGLMTVPPIGSDASTRECFKRMRELYQEAAQLGDNKLKLQYLSMGMTGDFEIAIEEGANIVRVGTGIFGKRNYKEE